MCSGGRATAAQKNANFHPADEWRAARKNERIADCPPENRDQARDTETLRQDRQHIFLPDQPTVKQRQSGKRHKENQRGSGHHPAVVARTGTGNIGSSFRILRIRTARGIIYVSFQVGHTLFERWRCCRRGPSRPGICRCLRSQSVRKKKDRAENENANEHVDLIRQSEWLVLRLAGQPYSSPPLQ